MVLLISAVATPNPYSEPYMEFSELLSGFQSNFCRDGSQEIHKPVAVRIPGKASANDGLEPLSCASGVHRASPIGKF